MEGKSLVFDNNDHDAPHDPWLVTILDRIHNNHIDKNSRSIKQLGVRLDENLTFQANHDAIVSKLNQAIFMINRIKNFIPSRALKTLYHSLFHCHLMYCPIITSCSSLANIEKLFKIQKKVIRIITHSSYHAHIEPLFTKLQIMPFHSIIKNAKLMFMHSIYHNYTSPAFTGHWTLNLDRDMPYKLRHIDDFSLPRTKYIFINSNKYGIPLHPIEYGNNRNMHNWSR
jgi:hypothetical protein